MSEYKMNELIFDTREIAEEIIEKLNEVVELYASASVSDLYDLADIQGTFMDNKYGWSDVSSAKVQLSQHGYILKIDSPVKFK